MSGPDEKKDYSLRNFPADVGAAMGLPVIFVLILLPSLTSLEGKAWIWAVGISFLVAVVGACLLLIAKWPLYREGRFFTFGMASLPATSRGYYSWGCWLSAAGCVVLLLLWLASGLFR